MIWFLVCASVKSILEQGATMATVLFITLWEVKMQFFSNY